MLRTRMIRTQIVCPRNIWWGGGGAPYTDDHHTEHPHTDYPHTDNQ